MVPQSGRCRTSGQASDGAVKTGETHLLRRARRTIRHVAGGVLKELERAVGRCDADLGSIPIYSPSTILHFLAILAETARVDEAINN
jgi:hypothetical protein